MRRFFYCFFSNHFCAEGLRCGQPGQQQGCRSPCLICSIICWICATRVASFFTIVTQQIHSLRWMGVSEFQRCKSSASSFNTFSMSGVNSCKIPELIIEVVYFNIKSSRPLNSYKLKSVFLVVFNRGIVKKAI